MSNSYDEYLAGLDVETLEKVKQFRPYRRHLTHCLCPGCFRPTIRKSDIGSNYEWDWKTVKLLDHEEKEFFCGDRCYKTYLEETGKISSDREFTSYREYTDYDSEEDLAYYEDPCCCDR
jgi:hypothetical protein